jgi:hypothetical protein
MAHQDVCELLHTISDFVNLNARMTDMRTKSHTERESGNHMQLILQKFSHLDDFVHAAVVIIVLSTNNSHITAMEGDES